MSDTASRAMPKINNFSLSRSRVGPVLLFIALLLLISLFFVWSRIQVINLEYKISSLEERLRTQQQETQRLRLEAASLRSPARIEMVAERELGLRYPTSTQVVLVKH